MTYTDGQAAAIWDILVRKAGALDDPFDAANFIGQCARGIGEWRFQGSLGFGGKLYEGRPPYVSCYPEDRTPERDRVIARTNEALAALFTETT